MRVGSIVALCEMAIDYVAGNDVRGLSHLPLEIGITDAPALTEAPQGFNTGAPGDRQEEKVRILHDER